MNNAPIAVFDSGMGGLTVWRALHDQLPHESLLYFGDGKNCPYGGQTREQVIGHVDRAVEQLLDLGVKMIVVACNTATSMTISHLRAKYPAIPFVGLEPAVKSAVQASHSGVIGVLATEATLNGGYFQEALRQYAERVKILSAVGEGFVELVEADREKSPEAVASVAQVIAPMLEQGIDQLVLGCTHYPFLNEAFRRAIGERRVALVDPAEAIRRRVETLLREFDLAASPDHLPEYTFYTASDEAYRQRIMAKSNALVGPNTAPTS